MDILRILYYFCGKSLTNGLVFLYVYQYIYLNDDGITQMVSDAGSKLPEWQDQYPNP